ncbi:hypothetical protein [Saccharomonospora sp.]|uniref:hypothetical protein n=1 Tax=Saccharomonospora sp. TaxID=33913 RepID=UPI00261D8600|nr:hypothetical protein [Saccharomonospora sp.]
MKRPPQLAALASGLALLAACSSSDGPVVLAEGVYHSMELGKPAAIGPVDDPQNLEGVVFTVDIDTPLDSGTLVLTSPQVPHSDWK